MARTVNILGLLQGRSAPYVVDVGANDGYSWSNSYLFGKLGFSLLLIEPMPRYADFCRGHWEGNPKVRVEQVAISPIAGETDFFITLDAENDLLSMGSGLDPFPMLGSETERITVPAEPLHAVLERCACPAHYAVLSIDAERRDLEVLQTAELDRFRPEIICVEELILGNTIPDYLAQRGYERLTLLGPNGIYRRKAG